MAIDLLLRSTQEFEEKDKTIIACSKAKPSEFRSGRGNLIGDVRRCAGYSTAVSLEERAPGGICQDPSITDELTGLCRGIAQLLPTAEALIKRGGFNGYGIKFEDGSEVVIKKNKEGSWASLLRIPKEGATKAKPTKKLLTSLKTTYGNEIEQFFNYLNGAASLPITTYSPDEFGTKLKKLNDKGLITLYSCGTDTCVKLSEKGFFSYFAFNRGKPSDGITEGAKHLAKNGTVFIEYDGLVTGVQKTDDGERDVYMFGDRIKRARDELSNKLQREVYRIKNNEELKVLTKTWGNQKIKDAVNELAQYERALAELGYSRPQDPHIITEEGEPLSSGSYRITMSPPVTSLDYRNKWRWDIFMANWLRMVQWWEPLVIGITGSPVKTGITDPSMGLEWIHSLNHHTKGNMKAGTAKVSRLLQKDGAVGVYGTTATKWTRESGRFGGNYVRSRKTDIGVGDQVSGPPIIWANVDIGECKNRFTSDEGRRACDSQTDGPAELRFFEYEPLHQLEERLEVIPLIMDRSYNLAAQEIEVPEPQDRNTYTDVMWKMIEKGYEATLTENEARGFSKVFTGKTDVISEGDTIETAGNKIINDLWKNYHGSWFTKYFGVDRKPNHINFMKDSKEVMEEIERSELRYFKLQ